MNAIPLAARIKELVNEYFPKAEFLQLEYILWPAMDEKDRTRYGRRIEQIALKPVLLETISKQDIQDLLSGVSRKEIRQAYACLFIRLTVDQTSFTPRCSNGWLRNIKIFFGRIA